MYARTALLYAASVWAPASRSYLNKLQVTQNKFLRVTLNVTRDTRIEDLHKLAKIESIDDIMSRMLKTAYNHDHDNPLIKEIGNYKIQNLQFKICCRLPKHLIPINTYSRTKISQLNKHYMKPNIAGSTWPDILTYIHTN